MLKGFEFQYPYMLFLLLIIPFLIFWQYYYRNRRHTSIRYSEVKAFGDIPKHRSIKSRLRLVPDILRYILLILLVLAIARPQSYLSRGERHTEGVDIIIALDISTSMLAEDFKPNRLESAKSIAKEFIRGRETDNIGLVIFAGEAFTQCPATTDQRMLIELLDGVETGMIADGTAIGDGIATAINRLRDVETKSKAIILLTDGVNNMGYIDPITAADLAKKYGIRLYTIGVGKMGMAPYPFQTPFGKQYQNVEVKIDDELLDEIANATGGKYFRSTDSESLETIFQEIDQMEKSIIDVSYYKEKKDLAMPLLYIALGLLFIEELLRRTYFRRGA